MSRVKSQQWSFPKWFRKDTRTQEQRDKDDREAKEEYNAKQAKKEKDKFDTDFDRRRIPVQTEMERRNREIGRELIDIEEQCPVRKEELERRIEQLVQNCKIKKDKLLKEQKEIGNLIASYQEEAITKDVTTQYKKANPFEYTEPLPEEKTDKTEPKIKSPDEILFNAAGPQARRPRMRHSMATSSRRTNKVAASSSTYLRYRDMITGRFVSPSMYTRH